VSATYRRLKLSLTDSCNLNCAHCYLGQKDGGTHAPVDGILGRIAEAKALGVAILDLTGGEPTAHPDFIRILDKAGAAGFERVNISTNGLTLTRPAVLERLIRWRPHCNISIDGATQQTVEAIRGKGTYRRLDDTLTTLTQSGVPVSLRFSVNSLNAGELDMMLDWAVRLQVPADFELTQLAGNADPYLLLDRDTAMELGRRLDQRAQGLAIAVEHSLNVPIPCDGSQSDLLSMNAQGHGVSCLMIEREDARTATAGWNVPLVVTWAAAQLRKARLAAFAPTGEKCASCSYLHLCTSGCWVTAHAKGCLT